MPTCRLLAVIALLLPFPVVAQTAARHPVLVELFTSEGCSSCPPADALLARLDASQPVPSAEIIVLGEHVDYWDSLGWRDRFSSPLMTERQRQYGQHFNLPDIYTPQMVVGGMAQINGSDSRAASRAIVQAAQAASLPLTLDAIRVDGRRVSATVHLGAATAAKGELYAAVVSPMETTQVRSGENGGQTLHHAGVVRALTRIDGKSLKDLAAAPVPFTVDVPASAQPLRLVVFAQAPGQGTILGAVSARLPTAAPGAVASR